MNDRDVSNERKNGSCDEIGSRAGQFEKRVHSMAGSGEVEIL